MKRQKWRLWEAIKVIINSTYIRTWARLGQRGTFFGIALPEIASVKKNLKVLTADLAILSGMERFMKNYPDQFINVGIAEQNMIGIGAGLAMTGDCVFASTYASFVAVRSLEQVRQHLAHLQLDIKIIGTSAGVVAAKSGISHWATEDISFMRALPNIEIYSPADSFEAYKIAHYVADSKKPAYVRLSGGVNCPIVYKEEYDFIPGKIHKIVDGKKIAIIATGLMVNESIKASEILREKGISVAVYNMHTIKPIDKKTLDEIFEEYSLIVSIEEHNVIGGIGSAIAEYKATKTRSPKQVFIGFQDQFTDAGSQRYVWEQAGITAEKIAEKIEEMELL